MVVTKKQVFWSKTSESHESIIEEFKLKEQDAHGNYTFVRIEIVPPDNNYTLPSKKWEYCLDQDELPKWYNAEDVERRARAKLKEWRKQKVVFGNKTRVLRGNEQVFAYDNSTVEAYGNSTVTAWDNSTVTNYTNLTKKILKSSGAVLIDRSGLEVKCYVGKG